MEYIIYSIVLVCLCGMAYQLIKICKINKLQRSIKNEKENRCYLLLYQDENGNDIEVNLNDMTPEQAKFHKEQAKKSSERSREMTFDDEDLLAPQGELCSALKLGKQNNGNTNHTSWTS